MGYRDEGFVNELTYVRLNVNIVATNQSLDGEPQPFDIFFLSSEEDYQCYIEAIQIMSIGGHPNCSFLYDQDITYLGLKNFSITEPDFMVSNITYQEFFLVIDNTEFPFDFIN